MLVKPGRWEVPQQTPDKNETGSRGRGNGPQQQAQDEQKARWLGHLERLGRGPEGGRPSQQRLRVTRPSSHNRRALVKKEGRVHHQNSGPVWVGGEDTTGDGAANHAEKVQTAQGMGQGSGKK